MTAPDNLVHMGRRAAIREVINRCIASGDDPEFIAWLRINGGFQVFTRGPIWKEGFGLASLAQNELLFEDPACADAVRYMEILEHEGASEARRWLTRRLRFSVSVAVSGRQRDGRVVRVRYYPVGSRLEASLRRPPRRKTEKINLTGGHQ